MRAVCESCDIVETLTSIASGRIIVDKAQKYSIHEDIIPGWICEFRGNFHVSRATFLYFLPFNIDWFVLVGASQLALDACV